MKKRIIKAAVTAILSLALYPLTNLLALAERGYQAIGGEEALLIFGLAASLYILAGKTNASPNENANEQESEESRDEDIDRPAEKAVADTKRATGVQAVAGRSDTV